MEGSGRFTRRNVDLADRGITFVEEATTLGIDDDCVHCTANTSTGDYTVVLPPVGLYKGRMLFIGATIANNKAVTLTDNNDDAGYSDQTLDTDDDHLLLYSDGITWREVIDGIAG